ncbi:MAG: carotenoid 1,2-hydratase, partial [Sphaerospermopsis sp. SIO1G2]|nr:carotenoid 1,2-hydratase [Sphaerospermopsis sp. SIO1G2]
MNPKITLPFIALLLIGGGAWWWFNNSTPTQANTSLTAYLSGDDIAGFAQALEPNAIQFPRDLGAHNDYQTEWWYYTGNLE